jgi:2-polyprenyl-3-methyl-5-hydroxy-6-metoxy-1,4-benzoquinol methylase
MTTRPDAYLGHEYSTKRADYFTSARRDFVAALPADKDARILELGCGNGATGALALQEGKCGTYVGIEMFEPMAREAEKVLSAVHIGDVQTMSLPYESESFDALICSEVLEHLIDPDAVLSDLARLVKPGGLVMASSPNISHWRIIAGLVRGRFEYSDWGVMDRTHLRWFTPRSFRALFEGAGFEITDIRQHAVLPAWKRMIYVALGPFRHLAWLQIQIEGRKRASP